MTLARKASGHVDGFVIEGDTAGGHNAPPRGPLQLNAIGEPIYGERDIVDLEKIRELGRPFWLAGSYGRPGRLAEALRHGASGVQVGTAFAFCNESGLRPELKQQALQMSRAGNARVFTDPIASPTGFPFKVVLMPGTLSEASHYAARTRICDLGYLRHLYRKPDGTLGYRCPAEPVDDYVKKGGTVADAQGRKCLCNGLVANIGLSQVRSEFGTGIGVDDRRRRRRASRAVSQAGLRHLHRRGRCALPVGRDSSRQRGCSFSSASKSSARVNIARPPSVLRGHCSCGRSQ